jgi:hypothetical protein
MASVRAAIHVNPRIPWHVRFASVAAMGLRSVGVPFAVTQSHERLGHAIPILLGTTFWRGIESSGPFLLVDRCSFGLNSSVAVDTVLAGIPTVTMDEAAMAWNVTSHVPSEAVMPDRTEWLHWLAWTQWTYDEIGEGTPWRRFL